MVINLRHWSALQINCIHSGCTSLLIENAANTFDQRKAEPWYRVIAFHQEKKSTAKNQYKGHYDNNLVCTTIFWVKAITVQISITVKTKSAQVISPIITRFITVIPKLCQAGIMPIKSKPALQKADMEWKTL